MGSRRAIAPRESPVRATSIFPTGGPILGNEMIRKLPVLRLVLSVPPHVAVLRVLLAVVVVVQAIGSAYIISKTGTWLANDWDILTEAGARITAGLNPYDVDRADRFRWSPLIAYFFAFIAPIGMAGWTAASLAFLAILRDWRVILAFLIALPFWLDISTGPTFLPFTVFAILGLRGEFWAKLAFVALAVLIPRPMALPILGWFLWHDRQLWWPSIAMAVGLAAGAVATGWADEWLAEVINIAQDEVREFPVVSPAAILGPWWILLVAFGAWLATLRRLGFAALAFSPYWNPGYLIVLLLEFDFVTRPRRENSG